MGRSETSVGYADLRPGDVVEVQIDAPLFPQVHGDWERREVIAVDYGGGEDAQPVHIVRFRDPSDGREYDIAPACDRGRRMRRVIA